MPVKKVTIHSHTRKSPRGKKHKVKGHKRKMRTLGKKVTYKSVGIFQVGHDEKGNFRGSKVVPLTKPLKIKKPAATTTKKRTVKKAVAKRSSPKKTRRSRVAPNLITVADVDTQFFNNQLTETQWLNARKRLQGLN